MRHPPSVCCLFGQTGCLTAQAADGILIVMTNDSLSILPDSFLFFHSSLAPCFFYRFMDELFIAQVKDLKCIIHLLLM